jgi:hypothetical protein
MSIVVVRARSLAETLTVKAHVGEPVGATPVLMLPGWFVVRTSGGGIPVLNEKVSRAYFTKLRGPELAPKLIQQIAHQLEQRCRDVRPRAYCAVD